MKTGFLANEKKYRIFLDSCEEIISYLIKHNKRYFELTECLVENAHVGNEFEVKEYFFEENYEVKMNMILNSAQ